MVIKYQVLKLLVHFCTRKFATRGAQERFDGEVIKVNSSLRLTVTRNIEFCCCISPSYSELVKMHDLENCCTMPFTTFKNNSLLDCNGICSEKFCKSHRVANKSVIYFDVSVLHRYIVALTNVRRHGFSFVIIYAHYAISQKHSIASSE